MPTINCQEVTWNNVYLDEFLAAIGTRPAAALNAAPKLRLWVGSVFVPTQASVLGNFTAVEATFGGYTAGGVTPTYTGPVQLDVGGRGLLVENLWLRDGTASTDQIGGWWIDNGTIWMACEKFANLVDIRGLTSYLDLLACLALPSGLAVNLS